MQIFIGKEGKSQTSQFSYYRYSCHMGHTQVTKEAKAIDKLKLWKHLKISIVYAPNYYEQYINLYQPYVQKNIWDKNHI